MAHDTRRDPPRPARPQPARLQARARRPAARRRSRTASRTSGASAPTSPTRSSSSSSTSCGTRSSRGCCGRRSSPRRAPRSELSEQARKRGRADRRRGARRGARDHAPRVGRAGAARRRAPPDQGAAPLRAREPSTTPAIDEREPVGESTGEIRRLISVDADYPVGQWARRPECGCASPRVRRARPSSAGTARRGRCASPPRPSAGRRTRPSSSCSPRRSRSRGRA